MLQFVVFHLLTRATLVISKGCRLQKLTKKTKFMVCYESYLTQLMNSDFLNWTMFPRIMSKFPIYFFLKGRLPR